MLPSRLRVVLAAASAVALFVVPTVRPVSGATPLPAHVYAPYFEMWTSGSISSIAAASASGGPGAKYFTLAFLQTLGKSSCTLAWNGSRSQTVATTPTPYLGDITTLRMTYGGDVIPSFGGWSADQGGTEIGDSCKSVSSIVAAYEQLVTTYGVTRLDMDIEGRSLTNTAGIDRRNKAIAQLQKDHPAVQVQYTLPTTRSGLEASGIAVLQNAVANGVRIDLVNPMAFDYYDHATTNMGISAINALTGLHGQLAALLGANAPSNIYGLEAVTLMPGIDDYNRKTEVTTVADAQAVLTFAHDKGMAAVSIWAIQRDNGGCAGVGGSNSCSGIVQQPYEFTHTLSTWPTP